MTRDEYLSWLNRDRSVETLAYQPFTPTSLVWTTNSWCAAAARLGHGESEAGPHVAYIRCSPSTLLEAFGVSAWKMEEGERPVGLWTTRIWCWREAPGLREIHVRDVQPINARGKRAPFEDFWASKDTFCFSIETHHPDLVSKLADKFGLVLSDLLDKDVYRFGDLP